MGNNWYVDYIIETRRRQEDIKVAQQYRLAKQAAGEESRENQFTVLQRSINRLGVLLVDWGYRLQARSGLVDCLPYFAPQVSMKESRR